MPVSRLLPCGCATCGCLCAEHSPDRVERPCGPHSLLVIAAWIAREAATLSALALLVAAAALVLPG